MGSAKALTLALGALLAAGAAASAADLLPPPPAPVPVAAPLDTSGWYIRADVGVGINQIDKLRSTFQPGFIVDGASFDQKSIADSAIIGAGVGYQLNNWFRADVTGEYRTSAAYKAIQSYGPTFCPLLSGRCYDEYNGQIGTYAFLVNGYVDLGTWWGLSPFIGGGVGVARHKMYGLSDTSQQLGGYGFAGDATKTNFAWQVSAGLGYFVSPNLKLELSYRYLDMGSMTAGAIACLNTPACGYEVQTFKLASHDIRLGMRWMLAAGDGYSPAAPALFAPAAPSYAPPPPSYGPGPLVRKY